MDRKEVLHSAEKCVIGDREEDYGTPEDSFSHIRDMWETYLDSLGYKLTPNKRGLTSYDVAAMMALVKIVRISSNHGKDDNWVDLAGYAACGGELQALTAKQEVSGTSVSWSTTAS